MACFLVPGGAAIVATAVERVVSRRGQRAAATGHGPAGASDEGKLPWRVKLAWLSGLLWGGAVLLALEHIWHGEVVLAPPFLTALNSPDETAVMLREMATVGVGMAAAVIGGWVVMIVAAERVPALRRALARTKA
jgi:hypothetical protein